MDTAVEEAVDNAKIEIAKNAIKEGLKDNSISKITGLSQEQIHTLRRSLDV